MWGHLRTIVGSITSYFVYEDSDSSDEDDNEYASQKFLKRLTQVSNIAQKSEEIGVITFINNCYGSIDGQHTFDIAVTNDLLQVGNKVSYTICRTKTGRRLVLNVSLLEADLIDDRDVWGDAFTSPCEEVTVIARDRRILTFSNGVECSMDNIKLEGNFLPVVGDALYFAQNNKLITLAPINETNGVGIIIEITNEHGIIEANQGTTTIFFTSNVLNVGYEPVTDDRVRFTAIQSTAGGDSCQPWRATSVVFEAHKEFVDEPMQFAFDGGKILIEGSTEFGEVIVNNRPKSIKLEICNLGESDIILEKIKFRRAQSQIVIETKTPLKIAGGRSEPLIVSCQAVFFGHNSEVADFIFSNQVLSRRFEMVGTTSALGDMMINTIPDFMVKKEKPPPPVVTECTNRTYGPRQPKKKMFFKVQHYAIPKTIENIFFTVCSDEISSLKERCPELSVQLSPQNYVVRFHTLLFIEECKVKVDMTRLSRSHVFFRRNGDMLTLDMPELAEQRPSLTLFDKVIVTQPWSEKDTAEHVGFIQHLSRDSLSVKFHESFHASYVGTDCDVRFEAGSSTFNYMHNAVVNAATKLGPDVLFPSKLTISAPYVQHQPTMHWYNKSLNEGQRKAVTSALSGTCRPLPHIIFGPPGTGKTVTMVETVLQVMRLCENARIVVSAPSNSACDLLAQRIIDGGKLRPGEIVRYIAYTRSPDLIPEGLEPYCMRGMNEDNEAPTDVALWSHRVIVGTCTVLAHLHLRIFHCTHVFIDEAGHATEPQLLIPLTLTKPGKGVAVLAGDPKQLGPVIMSAAKSFGLEESFLSRITERFPYARDRDSFPNTQGFDPRLITRLTHNYRSVPEILTLPNRLFYESELQPQISGTTGREAEIIQAFSRVHPLGDEPVKIMFHGVRGNNVQEPDSPSWLNPQELFETVQYVRLLYSIGVDSSELAIITPYLKQRQKIQEVLTEFNLEAPKVGTVEEMQGQERQVVILSCVRSRAVLTENDKRHNLGFLSNPRRVNVAITRARCLLIILGNPHILCRDTYWRSIVSHCVKLGVYKGCDIPANLLRN